VPARKSDLGDLRERLRPFVERARGFSGWSFEYHPRILGSGPPWSYEQRARELIRDGGRIVDLGTGGGEVLAGLIEGLEARAIATEEWDTNVPIARDRLGPLGVDVIRCRSPELPFADSSLDLVLSRHEIIDPFEVARVLAPGGAVLTQQVDHAEWDELREFFPCKAWHGDHYRYYQAGLRAAGLTVVQAQRHFVFAAYDFFELVYLLTLMPWVIPGFDPLGDDLPALLALKREALTADGIVLTEGRYVIEARKPAQAAPKRGLAVAP